MGRMMDGAKTCDSPYRKLMDVYICVGRMHRSILERELNKTGVYRGQHQLLMFIAEHPNISQKEIAKLNHVSSATVAVSLKKLEQGGYVRRAVDQEDNRFNRICITEKGSRVAENSIRFFHKTEQQMFAGFSEEDMAGLQNYLERIRGNLCELMPEYKVETCCTTESNCTATESTTTESEDKL